jgi:hypothetical protein
LPVWLRCVSQVKSGSCMAVNDDASGGAGQRFVDWSGAASIRVVVLAAKSV